MNVSIHAAILLVCPLLFAFRAEAQVYEVPRPFMPGIAKTVVRGNQAVIYYNPMALRRLGPDMDAFVRAHEYGHIRLGHFRRNISPRVREAEADIYAARVTSPRSAAAARQYFMSGYGGGIYHGTPRMRAMRVTRGMSYPSRTNFRYYR